MKNLRVNQHFQLFGPQIVLLYVLLICCTLTQSSTLNDVMLHKNTIGKVNDTVNSYTQVTSTALSNIHE